MLVQTPASTVHKMDDCSKEKNASMNAWNVAAFFREAATRKVI